MSIDPKRMERIWEKCPELRPKGLDFFYGIWRVDAGDFEGEKSPISRRDPTWQRP